MPIVHLWVPEESEKVNSLGTGLAILDGRSWGDKRELLCIGRSSPLTFPQGVVYYMCTTGRSSPLTFPNPPSPI